VEDTVVRLTSGGSSLRLRTTDQSGAAIPIDSSRTLQLEQGGRAAIDGTGFAPGTYVTVYLVDASGQPQLLGTVPVAPDGTFAATAPVAATIPVGSYTLQVNGIDRNATPRSVAVGVEVAPAAPDLEIVATPDQASPTVGDTITITLTVINQGPGPATDVVIPRAFEEPGFAVVTTTALEGSYDAAAREWTIGRIESGARARMLITAVVVLPPAAPQPSNP
jgi:hypothetical protein